MSSETRPSAVAVSPLIQARRYCSDAAMTAALSADELADDLPQAVSASARTQRHFISRAATAT
jgi:hypothetical protein